jgi:sulfide:quinone oxidoreductase
LSRKNVARGNREQFYGGTFSLILRQFLAMGVIKMVHVVILGAGIGGLPTAYELRRLLPKSHDITLISDNPKFTFIPSLPWVAFDLTPLGNIQLDIKNLLWGRGIDWIEGKVTAFDPDAQTLNVAGKTINYDYAVIATGASLALDAVPGLGPEQGYKYLNRINYTNK